MSERFFEISADGAALEWRPHPFSSVAAEKAPLAALEPIVVTPAVGTIATRNTYDVVEWSADRWSELRLRDQGETLRPSAGSRRWTGRGRSTAEFCGRHRDGSRWNQVVRRPDPPLPMVRVERGEGLLRIAVDSLAGWRPGLFVLKWIYQSNDNGAPRIAPRPAADPSRIADGLQWELSLRNARGVFALVLDTVEGARVLACGSVANEHSSVARDRVQMQRKFAPEISAVEAQPVTARSWRDSWPHETKRRISAAIAAVEERFGSRLVSAPDPGVQDLAALFRVYLLLVAGVTDLGDLDGLTPFRKSDFRQTVQSLFSLPAGAVAEGIPAETFLFVLLHARDKALLPAISIAPPAADAFTLKRALEVAPLYEKATGLLEKLADGEAKARVQAIEVLIRNHVRSAVDVTPAVAVLDRIAALVAKEETEEVDPNTSPPVTKVSLKRWFESVDRQRASRIALLRLIALCETGSSFGSSPAAEPDPRDLLVRIRRLALPVMTAPPAMRPHNPFRPAAEAVKATLKHEKLRELRDEATTWVGTVSESAAVWEAAHTQIALAKEAAPSLPWIARQLRYPWDDRPPHERHALAAEFLGLRDLIEEQLSLWPVRDDELRALLSTPGHPRAADWRLALEALRDEARDIYGETVFMPPIPAWQSLSIAVALKEWGSYLRQIEAATSLLKRRLENTHAALLPIVAILAATLHRATAEAMPAVLLAVVQRALGNPNDRRAQVALLRALVEHEGWRGHAFARRGA
jgi:hypothetical protein